MSAMRFLHKASATHFSSVVSRLAELSCLMCGLQSTKELGSLVKLERGGCEHSSSLVVASWASEVGTGTSICLESGAVKVRFIS